MLACRVDPACPLLRRRFDQPPGRLPVRLHRFAFSIRRWRRLGPRTAVRRRRTGRDRHERLHAGASGLGIAHNQRGLIDNGTTNENGRSTKQTPGWGASADQAVRR